MEPQQDFDHSNLHPSIQSASVCKGLAANKGGSLYHRFFLTEQKLPILPNPFLYLSPLVDWI